MEIIPSIQVMSGTFIDLTNPDPSLIRLNDIATVLSRICRYAGHTKHDYSVSEHSVHICRWLRAQGYDEDTQRQGLIHDAPEYLIGDMTRPLKQLCPEFKRIETGIWNAVCNRFEVDPVMYPAVKEADNRILFDEKAQVFKHNLDWGWNLEPLGVKIKFWSAATARIHFLDEANRLRLK